MSLSVLKISLITTLIVGLVLMNQSSVSAQSLGERCGATGQCDTGYTCDFNTLRCIAAKCGATGQCPTGFTCNMNTLKCIPSTQDMDASIGQIAPPPGAEQYTDSSGQVGPGGLVVFVSNILKLTAIVAGVWSLFNFAIASLTYITASGANVHEKVQNKLTLSLLGLILIVMSYTVAGVIGLIFFGDAGFILSPKIPTAPTP